MEKTLKVDGRDVRFKVTGGTTTRYKSYFGRDLFDDLLEMIPNIEKYQKGESTDNIPVEDLKGINFDLFFDLVWVFAKTADDDVPDKLTWLDTFDEFPVLDIFMDLQELLEKSLAVSKRQNLGK